jgi:predicted SAM-dependent methyltransferase
MRKYSVSEERLRMAKDSSSFLNVDHQDSLQGLVIFELKSLLGRLCYPIFNKNQVTQKYLNLGCGKIRPEGFVNLDFYNKTLFKKKSDPEVLHDMRYPLPFDENTFDGCFSEHTLEHLYPNQAFDLLSEVFRVLSDGGVFRISLPDINKAVSEYIRNDFPSHNARTRAERLNCQFRWGHRAVYDAEFLIYLLEVVGFSEVRECGFHEGCNSDLQIELPERQSHSFYVEALKLAES